MAKQIFAPGFNGSPVAPVAAFVGNLFTSLTTVDANKDGKISWIEGINKIQVIGLQALSTFSGFELTLFRQGLDDLRKDAEARKQMIEAFVEKFELSNREAEYLFEDFIRWLADGVTLFNRLQSLNQSKAA